MDKDFSHKMPDIHGVTPDNRLLGLRLHHANGKDYVILGFAWIGASDEWGYKHVSPEGVEIVRPIYHIIGNRKDGSPRYTGNDYAYQVVMEMMHHG